MSNWYKRLLILLLMASDPKPGEEKRIIKLANELLEEWITQVPK